MSQQGQGQGHDKGRNRLGQGHGSLIFAVRKRRASAWQGARTDSGKGTAARFLRCRGDVRVQRPGARTDSGRGTAARFLTVRKRHANAPCGLFSECTLKSKRECTLDSAPHTRREELVALKYLQALPAHATLAQKQDSNPTLENVRT